MSPLAAQKTGVILSGGGAKALTHIGFLQTLEEKNIYIDAIGGTSMGALIGALYASGYSTKQIKNIFNENVIGAINDGILPYNQHPYLLYNLNHNDNYFSYGLSGFNSLIDLLPISLVRSEPLDIFLLHLFTPFDKNNLNFDSLTIPFRCFAAEVNSKSLYTFKNGSLFTAIRASMAYPLILPSMEKDSLIFMDGGLYDNFPLNSFINTFQPSIILGSNTTEAFPSPIKNKNTLYQILNLVTRNSQYQLPDSIHGKIINHKNIMQIISTFGFYNLNEIIDIGYSNSKTIIDSISPILKKNVSSALHTNQIKQPIILKNLFIQSPNPKQKKYIQNVMRLNSVNYNMPLFEKRFNKIFSDERFSDFKISPLFTDTTTSLNLYSPSIKKIGLYLTGNIFFSNNGTSTNLALGPNINFFALHSLIQMSVVGGIGNYLSYIQPQLRIDMPLKKPIAIIGQYQLQRFDYYSWQASIFNLINPYFIISTQNNWNIALQTNISHNDILQIAYTHQNTNNQFYLDGVIRPDQENTDQTMWKTNAFNISWTYNTLNNNLMPTQGSLFFADFKYYDVKTEHNYINNIPLQNTNNFYQTQFIFKTGFEISPNWSKTFRIGLSTQFLWSNIGLQKDYFSTLIMMPKIYPIPEMQARMNANYASPHFLMQGLKFTLTPFKNSRSIGLRLEAYFLLTPKKLQKNNNNTTDFILHDMPDWNIKEFYKQPILSGSFVWLNKHFPINAGINYYIINPDKLNTSNINQLNVFLSVGYFFKRN